jgi:hypothetical protein
MHEVRFRHKLAFSLKQRVQKQQTSTSEGNRRPIAEEHSPVRVEQERTEYEGLPGHGANLERITSEDFAVF